MTIISDAVKDEEILKLIGSRIKQRRLGRNITVDELAGRANLNRKTLIELEAGRDVRVSSLFKMLRGLSLLGTLEAVLPDVAPVGAAISSRGQPRKKASGRRK